MQIYTHLVKTNPEAETANPSYTATTTESSTTVTDKCMSEHSQAVHATIEILNDGTHALGEEVLGLSNDALPLQQSIEKIEEASSAMEGTIKESNSLMEAINSNISILQQDLSLLKQAYEDHQIASYDGTLFWKIAGVHDKMSKNFLRTNPCHFLSVQHKKSYIVLSESQFSHNNSCILLLF